MTYPPVFDGHNDVLLHLMMAERGGGRSFFEPGTWGHLDLPRAREGGFAGGFFAVYVPSPDFRLRTLEDFASGYRAELPQPLDFESAAEFTCKEIALLHRLAAESDGGLKVVRSVGDIRECIEIGTIAALMHIEGAEGINPDLSSLQDFYNLGVRSVGIVWSRPNAFGHGVPFAYPSTPDTGPGLSEAGKALVRAGNELGIVVDMAHLNEQGFWDVAGISWAPLVVTHSAAHALCPSSRNLTDRQLDAIRDSDGIVGLSFTVSDLRPDGRPDPHTPLDVAVDHFEYLVNRVGINRVALGSDFDGTTVPEEIGDVTGLPRLLAALECRGYGWDELCRIANGNWLRVLGATWK